MTAATSLVNDVSESCIPAGNGNKFAVRGYNSGTHLIQIYLRGLVNNEHFILSTAHGIFELVSLNASSSRLAPEVLLTSHYDLLDTITTYWPTMNSDFSAMLTPLTKVVGMSSHPLRVAPWLRPVQIVIYLKEIRRHGANNRLLHWLLDHSTFLAHNHRLTVVTGSDNSAHDLALLHQLVHTARVIVLQYYCLSPVPSDYSIDVDSMKSLSVYLRSGAVDALLAVNTMGDPLTDRLLLCAHRDIATTATSNESEVHSDEDDITDRVFGSVLKNIS